MMNPSGTPIFAKNFSKCVNTVFEIVANAVMVNQIFGQNRTAEKSFITPFTNSCFTNTEEYMVSFDILTVCALGEWLRP